MRARLFFNLISSSNFPASLFALFCALSLCVFVSCSSMNVQEYDRIENDLRAGKINSGIKRFEKMKEPKGSDILHEFDLAMLKHYAGDYTESIDLLNDVHEKMEDAVTKSVSRQIGAALWNDNIAEYTGTVYEYLYVNAFNALNYYNAGDFDEAMVEVRRIGTKEREYMAKYGETVKHEAQYALEQLQTQSTEDAKTLEVDIDAIRTKAPSVPTDDEIFRDSCFARYVSMVFRLMDGDVDNARVDGNVLRSLNPNAPVEDILSVPQGKGAINFVALSGLIGHRIERTFYFPGDFMPFGMLFLRIGDVDIPAFRLKFAWPEFDESSVRSLVSSVRVSLSNSEGKTYDKTLSLIEDLSTAVAMDVKAKAPSAFARAIIRSIVKKAAAVTAGAFALKSAKEKSGEGLAGALIYAASYASVVAAINAVDATETADIRQCRLLPGKVSGGGMALDAGVYSGKVQFLDASGKVISEKKFDNITVQNGKSVLVEAICLQ